MRLKDLCPGPRLRPLLSGCGRSRPLIGWPIVLLIELTPLSLLVISFPFSFLRFSLKTGCKRENVAKGAVGPTETEKAVP